MTESGGGDIPRRGTKHASYPIRTEQPTVFFGKNIFTKWLPPDPFHNSGSTLKLVRAVWKADTENGAVRGGAERQKLFTMLVLMKTRNNAVLAWSYFSEKKFLSESEKRACQGRGFSLEISSRRSGGIGRHARFRV